MGGRRFSVKFGLSPIGFCCTKCEKNYEKHYRDNLADNFDKRFATKSDEGYMVYSEQGVGSKSSEPLGHNLEEPLKHNLEEGKQLKAPAEQDHEEDNAVAEEANHVKEEQQEV